MPPVPRLLAVCLSLAATFLLLLNLLLTQQPHTPAPQQPRKPAPQQPQTPAPQQPQTPAPQQPHTPAHQPQTDSNHGNQTPSGAKERQGGGGHGNHNNNNNNTHKTARVSSEAETLGGFTGTGQGVGTAKGCEVTLSLAPCPCVRTVKAAVPRCPEGGYGDVLERVKDTLGESTCSDWATVRGGGQRVVSYSLFGAFPSPYHRGIEVLAGRVRDAYPGWTIRLHHDLDLSSREQRAWACDLACTHPHVDLCHVSHLSGGVGDVRGSVGSVWRVAVLGDPLVAHYMVRDADAPLLPREVAAVAAWLTSGKCFHVMRDSPHHDQGVMAGMWGGCGSWHASATPALRRRLFRWCTRRAPPSVDQLYINLLLWPLIRRNLTAHDAYHCSAHPGSTPFPTRRRGRDFVGMRTYRPQHAHDALSRPCPAACRPPRHQDWLYC
ncbi:hypothetical protein GWK47_045104 [Chionoecetes opilio]|uniref:Uncharacterized protein n=1 Tax=Chionoecetes opilio TaxID=41210 RepID=A0A8J4Y7L9_CHIOP|nr:hypothetical protein GWK47_045104 [Chionoecetes opilio]